MNWAVKRFSQIMHIKKGEAITKATENEGQYPVILGGQEPAYYIDRFNHEGKAIVVSRSGASAGYVSFWNEPIFITDGFLVEPINKEYCLEYIYYLLKQYGKALRDLQNGAAIPHVTPKTIYGLKAPIPSSVEQERIASTLTAYDNLIEVNNKRIKVLEQMAENLYKEWFVRFRFPGHETAEFENGIPKGWKTTRLGEIMSFTRGVGYSSEDIVDGKTALLSMNNIRPYGGYISDNSRVYSGKYKKDQLIEENDLIMSITDMTQDRRIIGYTGIANYSEMPRVICTHLMKITSNEYDNFFLYSFFTYSGLSRYISEYATGANVLGLTADILKRIKCNIPDVRMAKRFSEKVKPVFYHIHLLEKSNSILIKQRDLLLPRLMSGKLEV